jgi:undecaprenyl diphosphate synthase
MNTTMDSVPKHIAIIMDGNRRWARERGLPVLEGHRRVTDDILEPLIEHASSVGVQYLTLWAWSTENWGRASEEVSGIMMLFRNVIARRWKRLSEKGVRIKTIGDIDQFPLDIRDSIRHVVEETQNNTKITVILALNYGGRDEIVRAIRKLPDDQHCSGVTIQQVNNLLDTSGVPDPELIIRTGGEKRLSGFLLWQSNYSELSFPEWYMPDFTPERLDEAIVEYQNRSRRFGK